MAESIPALRRELDGYRSPDPERPGLVLRDPFGYTDAVALIPPPWLPALGCCDGAQTILDCQAALARASGEIVPAELVRQFVALLDERGFLASPAFAARKRRREAEFAAAPVRAARHAGAAYAADPEELRATLAGYYAAAPAGAPAADDAPASPPLALAAPHVSPFGGATTYAAAYRQWPRAAAARDVIVLGTSHYGPPNRFGLTRKPFATPLGTLPVAADAVDFLVSRAAAACRIEDYCHAVEHSIEFQCVFAADAAARRGAPPPRIVPILCGPIAGEDPDAERFFDALAELAARPGGRLWVLGIDLAHIGRRYGDALAARAETGTMLDVRARDHERLAAALAGDAAALRALVRPPADELRWCGFAPLYAFLRAQPQARGRLLGYEQWNIDPESVVSFAALRFDAAAV